MSSPSPSLRIGYVPEHFSTPLHFAKVHFALSATLVPYPSGTGHMVTALAANEIDICIGLTEAWVAALGKAQMQKRAPTPTDFKVVGTYVETPLCWAISTGRGRGISDVGDLKGKHVGVSRMGSGSHIMSFVLADQQGWLSPAGTSPPGRAPSAPFQFVPLQTFAKLREGVNDSTADFFMWEHFTSKRYHDSGSIKRIGHIYTPWPSWMVVAQTRLGDTSENGGQPTGLTEALGKVDRGIEYFNSHHDEAVTYISTELDYSEEDAKEWLNTVRFTNKIAGVPLDVLKKTVEVLKKGGVLEGDIDHVAMVMDCP